MHDMSGKAVAFAAAFLFGKRSERGFCGIEVPLLSQIDDQKARKKLLHAGWQRDAFFYGDRAPIMPLNFLQQEGGPVLRFILGEQAGFPLVH